MDWPLSSLTLLFSFKWCGYLRSEPEIDARQAAKEEDEKAQIDEVMERALKLKAVHDFRSLDNEIVCRVSVWLHKTQKLPFSPSYEWIISFSISW